jgi:plasmid stability protein
MATLTIRNLSEAARRGLKLRAARNNRSMEAEVRDILESVAGDRDFVSDWLDATSRLRGADLELPERSVAREIDLA